MTQTFNVTMPCRCEASVECEMDEGSTGDPFVTVPFVRSVELPERALSGRLYPACPECGREVDEGEVLALCQQAFARHEEGR